MATRKVRGKQAATRRVPSRTAPSMGGAAAAGPKAQSAMALKPRPRSGQNKTVPTGASVAAFVAAVPDARRRQEADVLIRLMRRISGHAPRMWGPSIIGFGQYHYRYDTGREGQMPRIAFSPRKAALTLYLSAGYPGHDALMKRLGRHTTSVACLYVKRLEDVDLRVLEELARRSWAHMAVRYPDAAARGKRSGGRQGGS